MNIQEYNKHIKLHGSKWNFEKLNKHLEKLGFTATVIDHKDTFTIHIIVYRIDESKNNIFSHIYVTGEFQLYQFKKKNIKEFIKVLIPN